MVRTLGAVIPTTTTDHELIEAEMPAPTEHPVALDAIEDAAEREALAAMRERYAFADPLTRLGGDVQPTKVPEHIAIIMDGNGRWAQERGLSRTKGHYAGMVSVEHIIREAKYLGVGYLTLYSFSTENWKRPEEEVRALMELYVAYMSGMRERFIEHDVRVVQIGRRDRLSAAAQAEMQETLDATAGCKGITLVLAVDYSSRDEITRAVVELARSASRGEIDPDSIDQEVISRSLDTAEIPDPDLLIRTGGDLRLSNYLLWQLSYAEIHPEPAHWPDFRSAHLHRAIREFASRERRFGALTPAAE